MEQVDRVNTRKLGRIDLRHSQGFDLQQDDLRNAPDPSLAMNTANGYKLSPTIFCRSRSQELPRFVAGGTTKTRVIDLDPHRNLLVSSV